MDSEAVSLDIEESNTFITKLIVEMKNTFNKTEKKLIPPEIESSSEPKTLDPEVMEENEIKSDNTVLENLSNDLPAVPDDEDVIVQENNCQIELPAEEIQEKIPSPEEIVKLEDEAEIQPRIVMHFRKPLNTSTIKVKNDPDNLKSRRSLRNKIQETQLKRSARRRISKDGESVLQSAIARKEKSYNEAAKPQRLTRQLKLTPKILENLNQNQFKEKYKNKTSAKMAEKQSIENDTIVNMTENSVQMATDDRSRKHKLKSGISEKLPKRTNKRLKSNQSDSKDSDNDQNIAIKEKEVNELERNHFKVAGVIIEERRRSQRKSTRYTYLFY